MSDLKSLITKAAAFDTAACVNYHRKVHFDALKAGRDYNEVRAENTRLQPLLAALADVADDAQRVHDAIDYAETHNAHAELGMALARLREVVGG